MRGLVLLVLLAGCPKPVPVGEASAGDVWFGGSVGTPDLCLPALHAAGPMDVESRALWKGGVEALRVGDLETAGLSFRRAGDHPSAQAGRGVHALVTGNPAEAGTVFEALITAWPDEVCLLHTGAFVAIDSGDTVTAKARIERARKLSPDSADVAWVDYALTSADDPEAGLAILVAFRESHPPVRLVEATLASRSVQAGDLEGALPYLEALVDLGEPVREYLIGLYEALGRRGDALRMHSEMGAPLGDGGRIATAADPAAAYYEVLGMQPGERLVATITTSGGALVCELFPESAPVTVANFVGLSRGTIGWVDPATGAARSDALYPQTGFHRVIPEFMIQGGDPAGDGSGGPGYRFADEIDPGLTFDRPGRLAMANSGPGTNGSQWFVTEVPTPHLDGRHTIFGQCDEASVEVVKRIARVPAVGDTPKAAVRIEGIEVRAEAPGPG